MNRLKSPESNSTKNIKLPDGTAHTGQSKCDGEGINDRPLSACTPELPNPRPRLIVVTPGPIQGQPKVIQIDQIDGEQRMRTHRRV